MSVLRNTEAFVQGQMAQDLIMILFASLPVPGRAFDEVERAKWFRHAESTFDLVYGVPGEVSPPQPRLRNCLTCGEPIPVERGNSVFCRIACVKTPRQLWLERSGARDDTKPLPSNGTAPLARRPPGPKTKACVKCQQVKGYTAYTNGSDTCRSCTIRANRNQGT